MVQIFQSTLPRGERHLLFQCISPPARISIHAPTRGATKPVISKDPVIDISIHAPTRGATKPPTSLPTVYHFNPRSHEGSDAALPEPGLDPAISIHAPTRGATSEKERSYIEGLFQSTLPRGERLQIISLTVWIVYFNPRSHEGSDLGSNCERTTSTHFNPRSHEGSDPTIWDILYL